MNVKVVTAKKEGAPLLSGTGIPQNIKFVMGVVLILLIVAGIVLLFVVGKGVFYGKALEIPSITPPEPIASTWLDFVLGPQGMGRFTYLAMPYILYAPDPSSTLNPLVNGALCYCAKESCPDFNSCVASMKTVEGATKGEVEVIYYTFVTSENICYTANVLYRVDSTDSNNPSRVAADVYLCSDQAVPDADRDGVGDLADQCLSTPAGASVGPTTGCSSESKCDDQIDDDGDGKIDCADSDCDGFEVCFPSIGPPPALTCTDTDNDGYCAESPPPGECVIQGDISSCPPASPPEGKLGWNDCDDADILKYILLQQFPDSDGDLVPNENAPLSECGTGQTQAGYVASRDIPRTIPEGIDNCPTVANPDQIDSDRDGIGDVCETPTGASPPQVDLATQTPGCNDRICQSFETCASCAADCNTCQAGAIDSDSDGVPDSVETDHGLNPNSADSDADGIPDGRDYCPATNVAYPDFTHDLGLIAVNGCPHGDMANTRSQLRPDGCFNDVDVSYIGLLYNAACTPITYGVIATLPVNADEDSDGIVNSQDYCPHTNIAYPDFTHDLGLIAINGCPHGDMANANGELISDGCVNDVDVSYLGLLYNNACVPIPEN